MPTVQEEPTLEFGEATRSVIDPQIPAPIASVIDRELPERHGERRKMSFLFREGETYYVRVNFQKSLRIDSYWATVTGGAATVSAESNREFKADGK